MENSESEEEAPRVLGGGQTVLVSGGHGFLGSALVKRLRKRGSEVRILTRSPRDEGDVKWDPASEEIDLDKVAGVDAVIHLAGESLVSGRWTDEKKETLRSSRVDATRFLVRALGTLDTPPAAFLSGSAIGIYGNRGDQLCPEDQTPGRGFLAELCVDWENAARDAEAYAKRIVFLRTGIVLSPESGALALMLPIFKKGLGGKIGNGRMWMSWVSVEDWVEAVVFLLDSQLSGPVNLVAPGVVSNEAFTNALGEALGKPTIIPVPRFALKALYGRQMAKETVLSSCRVEAKRLSENGFMFQHPEIEEALGDML